MTSGYLPLPIGTHNPLARPSDATPSVAVFATELLRVGMVNIAPTHPLFRSGPTPGDMIVFPQTAFRLARQGDRTRTVDTSVAVTYVDQQEFRRDAATDAGSKGMWIAIAPILRRELCVRAGLEAFPATALTLTPSAFAATRRLLRDALTADVDTLAIEEGAVLLLHTLFSTIATPAPHSCHERDARIDLVDRTRLVLSREICRNRSIGEIAALVGASPGHLCRAFRSITGTSILAYRRNLRLRTAMRWLDDTSLDLSHIAMELGFTSHAHFTMWFRRTWGITPSQYRSDSSSHNRR